MVDLNDFANGALAERFNYELQKVLENISDPNTDFKAKRKMDIKLTFETNEERELASVSIQVKSTPAPRKNIGSAILIDRDGTGKTVGAELKSGIKGQTYFDTADGNLKEDTGNVIDYRKQKEGGSK
ncbi:replication terminator protein [Gracilibacillus oryzae]|uniref:Replication terminator protein n=2 Tax=Gracilibacillus oryzae TaxID=1672701 RepID=A0A7C8KX39_9BACI|nr:replication terminator protein [Gracilibacillus oryzae]